MIWKWINAVVAFFREFFVPPIPPPVLRVINENARCPSCGGCLGRLTAVHRDGKMLVQHDCKICKAKWWEAPVEKQAIAPTSATVIMEAPAPAKE
jgi:hypothetical protein